MMEEEIKQTLAEQEADENLRAALAMPQDHRERKACCTILQRLLKYLYEDRHLRGIAESIRQKIADLEQKLRTPAPKLKVALIMISALMMVAVWLFSAYRRRNSFCCLLWSVWGFLP